MTYWNGVNKKKQISELPPCDSAVSVCLNVAPVAGRLENKEAGMNCPVLAGVELKLRLHPTGKAGRVHF